jgi:hypothetical protein
VRLILAAIAFCLAVVGCSKPGLPDGSDTARKLEQLFPLIVDLQLRVYLWEEDCEYVFYRRGAFASNPNDQWCRVFDFDGRHPGGNGALLPRPFDDVARADLDRFKSELKAVGIRVDYLNAVFDVRSGDLAGPSNFSIAGTCGTLEYSREWSPEDMPRSFAGDSEVYRVDDEWFLVDYCPPHQLPAA